MLTGLIVGYFLRGRAFHGLVQRKQGRTGPVQVENERLLFMVLWAMVICNVFIPIPLFQERANHWPGTFSIAMLVLIGMWFERLVIIVSSGAHDCDSLFLGSLSPYPFGGRVGHTDRLLQHVLFPVFLFAKFLPTISMAE